MSNLSLVRLGDVCQTTSGGTPSRVRKDFYGGDIPWIKSGDLTGGLVNAWGECITEAGLKNSSAKLFKPGTLLIAMYGATVGKLGILEVEAATNQAICGITPGAGIDTLYLFYFLLHRQKYLIGQSIGGAQPNISQKVIRELRIPVPLMAEQHRIVNILKRADRIRRLRKQAQDTARQLIPALFIDMFGDPVANLNGWNIKPLKEVADIGSGVTKGRKLDGHRTIELPYLAVSNVQDGYLNLSKVKSIRIKPTEIEKYKVIPGDFLMTEGGDPDKLGRGAIWNGEIDVCLHQNHIFKVRCKRELLLPEYLKSLVGSRYGKGYFLRVAKQTTGIASINKTQLGKFPVLVPPIELQNDFVARVEGIQSIIGQQEAAQASAESSFQSLLSRAFTGKL